jgi:hypothetical protein
MINFEYNSSGTVAPSAKSKSDDYRARAAYCADEAQNVSNETRKRVCKDMARAWLRLAEEAQKYDSKCGRLNPSPTTSSIPSMTCSPDADIGIATGGTAMAVRQSNLDRRAGQDRRSGVDTRSDEEKRLQGEKRSGTDRRSGLDRRSKTAGDASPPTTGLRKP